MMWKLPMKQVDDKKKHFNSHITVVQTYHLSFHQQKQCLNIMLLFYGQQ